ncbi:MAG TPA: DUF4007 family protein [Sphingomonas sp.]|jgi:hypothetical protein
MTEVLTIAPEYRFGGHQSFALRIAWLPKAVAAIEAGIDPLTDPIVGVVELGLGKNMVEALRCWIGAFGVAERGRGGWTLTPMGAAIFGSGGHDRFLEDVQTLWWLHWTISTRPTGRFFAWELLINRWAEPTFSPSIVVAAFLKEAEQSGRRLSPVSARQHFDVWLHSYLARRSGRGEESLDSPMTALALVRPAGERDFDGGRREPVYSFDRGPKQSLGSATFAYALTDWWDRHFDGEETAPLREVAFGRSSPGQVFRLSEHEVRERVAALSADTGSGFALRESLNQHVVQRTARRLPASLLTAIYAAQGTVSRKGARRA